VSNQARMLARTPLQRPATSSTSLPALQGTNISPSRRDSPGRNWAKQLHSNSQRPATVLSPGQGYNNGSSPWRNDIGSRCLTPLEPRKQSRNLPFIEDDWEQLDQEWMERVRKKLQPTPKKILGPVSFSAPDLHGKLSPGQRKPGAAGAATGGRTASKTTSLPALPIIQWSADGRTPSKSAPKSPSSKENSLPAAVLDSGAPRRGISGEEGTPVNKESGTPKRGKQDRDDDGSEDWDANSQKTPKTPCPFEMDGWELGVPRLGVISKQWGIPFGDLQESSALFGEFAQCSGHDRQNILRDGRISRDDFYKVLVKLTDSGDVKHLPHGMGEEAFQVVDSNRNGWINFWEFAVWHESMAFCESIMLSKEERHIREVARKLNITAAEMDRYSQLYHKFDFDSTGLIEYEEFRVLMHTLMKYPPGLEIPEKRLAHFWSEADCNGNGKVDLEEFIRFYSLHFDIGSTDPMESFYNGFLPKECRGLSQHPP